MMLKYIDIKNGKVIKNNLNGDYEMDILKFTSGEEVSEISYGEYAIKVINMARNTFKVLITKTKTQEVVVKQEVGDFESLLFTIQNYIDLLASFKDTKELLLSK